MDIQFYGANCVTITTKQGRLVIDDNLKDLGAKSITKKDDVVLFTGGHGQPEAETHLLIDHAGEYEVSDIAIYGIPARGHMQEADRMDNTIYKIITDDVRILVTGHVYPELSESQLEAIGMVDIMIVPVGGNGYTLDPVGALQLIKKIEPKSVMPTHFADKRLNYPVPQQSLEDALKGLGMEPAARYDKWRVKTGDLPDTTALFVVNPS